jgi:DNA polymerase elongation subunit (family B)
VDNAANLVALPDDSQALKAMLRTLIEERDQEKRRADQETRRSDELRVEMLRLQLELERYKKWYYGPRADRLQSPPIWRRCF